MSKVFVFGSNLAGRHGAGSALEAVRYHGAIPGQGEGPQGDSYAIPTKDRNLNPLSLAVVQMHVSRFLDYARKHNDKHFDVVKVGCGLAGFDEADIALMFELAPKNCHLPLGWRKGG